MNSKLKNIKKMKLIIFWVICALIALFFKFSMVTPTYAYYLNGDGNIQSNNLYNKDNIIATNQLISHENGNVFNNFNGYYISNYIEVDSNSYYSCNNWNSYYSWWYDTNKNPISVLPSNVTTALSPSNAKYLRLSSNDIDDLMLNKGNSVLTYESYGSWISQDNIDYNNALLANMGLLQYLGYMQVINNVTNQNIEINGINEFTKEYLIDNQLISSSGVLNLNYFNTSALNPNYNPYKIVFYFDSNISLNLFNLAFQNYSGGTMTLIGNGTYIIQINSDVLSYDSNIINDTTLTYIDEIVITFDSADALSNINFNSYSIVNYNNGYNYGYNKGDSVGYQRGYNEGDSVGYQRGYNEGIEQDFENGGFKTLITSILSYPVNMVRECLNFEFMGINIASIVLFLISLGIVAFVIKRFKD